MWKITDGLLCVCGHILWEYSIHVGEGMTSHIKRVCSKCGNVELSKVNISDRKWVSMSDVLVYGD